MAGPSPRPRRRSKSSSTWWGGTKQRVRRLTQNWTLKDHLVWVTPKPGVGSRVPEKAVVTCEHSLGIWGNPLNGRYQSSEFTLAWEWGKKREQGLHLLFIIYRSSPTRRHLLEAQDIPPMWQPVPVSCPRPPGYLKMLSKQLLQTA